MDLLKIISLVLFSQIESLSESQKQKIQAVKIELRREVLTVVLKILVGFALTAGIVISVLHLGDSLHQHLSEIENQFLYELLSFGSFGLLCSIFLILLFRNDLVRRRVEMVPNQTTHKTIDFESLLMTFLEGFLDGLEKINHKNKKRNEAETDASASVSAKELIS